MEYWLFIIGGIVGLLIVVLRIARRDDTRDAAVHLGQYDEPGQQADIEGGPIRRGGVTIPLGGGSGFGGGPGGGGNSGAGGG